MSKYNINVCRYVNLIADGDIRVVSIKIHRMECCIDLNEMKNYFDLLFIFQIFV